MAIRHPAWPFPVRLTWSWLVVAHGPQELREQPPPRGPRRTQGPGGQQHQRDRGRQRLQLLSLPPNGNTLATCDTRSLGRLITGADCIQAIREGKTRYEPTTGTYVPFDSYDLHEFWFSDFTISNSQLNFTMAPLFYVLNPSRYHDSAQPNKLSRQATSATTRGSPATTATRSAGSPAR